MINIKKQPNRVSANECEAVNTAKKLGRTTKKEETGDGHGEYI